MDGAGSLNAPRPRLAIDFSLSPPGGSTQTLARYTVFKINITSWRLDPSNSKDVRHQICIASKALFDVLIPSSSWSEFSLKFQSERLKNLTLP